MTEAHPHWVWDHMPKQCEFLLIKGMSIDCLDSFSPSRCKCDHHISPRCWDLSDRGSTKSEAVLEKTPIICLCGSTKFTREMLIKQWELTKRGYIVVSWCALPDDYYQGEEKAHIGDQEGVKAFVDEVHKRKIDLADEVLVIDIGGYIGSSTRSEIDYAVNCGKPVRYLSAELRSQTKEREQE